MSDDEVSNSGNHHRSMSSSRRKNRLSSAMSKDISSLPVLSADYLARYASKNDLVKRLRNIVEALSDDNVEVDSPEYPGLARLANDLVEDRYLKHKDKEVRLYTVLACMEIFRVYVPEPPYDENEVLKIFTQVIQQLGNLTNCTSPKQSNFTQYLKLLQRLANFKIGVVLVEMTKTLDLESEFSSQISDIHRNRYSPSSQEAMEVLRELIEVLLNSIQIDHPNEVKALAVSAISGCIEEFYGTVPIPILDEILKCIGMGPVIYITNPAFVEASAALASAKKQAKSVQPTKLPPMQVQQTNQSYMVACSVIKKTLDKLSTPTASLLNGLLNGDTNIMKYSNIACSDEPVAAEKGTIIAAAGCIPEKEQQTADVWSIVYELHKVAPQILTTVIGTVAASLQSPDDDRRLQVTKLMGRLFYSRTSNIGVNFHLCYKDWIKRSMDLNVSIREMMVKCLLEILKNKGNVEILCQEASDALVKMVTSDPSNDIRILCIHKICDLAYNINDKSSNSHTTDNKSVVPAELLHAIGNRVSSKNKKERIDSLTGLAKIYHRHYIMPKLKQVQEGGDDCNINVILETIHCNCDLKMYKLARKGKRGKSSSPSKRFPISNDSIQIDEKYKFIAQKVFDSAFFTDKTDPLMRNRVVNIVDDVLLGIGTKNTASSDNNGLTSTSRALGLVMIVNHLMSNNSNEIGSGDNGASFKWMRSLLVQRAQLQLAVQTYIDTRAKAEKFSNGTEERNNANYEAYEKLKLVASLISSPNSNTSPGASSEGLDVILKKIHTAKDKHIFRLLASISSPTHSLAARARALEELPKRTKSLGSQTASWIKVLARRCAMGNFVNVDTVTHCILLAQEALRERDFQVTMAFLECVKIAVNIYPSLGGTREGFETLVELFGECRSSLKGNEAEDAKETGILTTIIGILAVVTPTRMPRIENDVEDEPSCEDELKMDLYKFCQREGTPEQARQAVFTLAALANKDINTNLKEQQIFFAPLLKSLTSSSNLNLSGNDEKNENLISVFSALTALVECAPMLFMNIEKNDRGKRAIRFALDCVLLGKNQTGTDSSREHEGDSMEVDSPPKRRNNKKHKDEINLSVSCRLVVAVIDFLVCHIRFSILQSRKKMNTTKNSIISLPSNEHIATIFDVLINLINDKGLFSANHNLRNCSASHERSSLRKCASVSLLRLCDGSLNIESKFLSQKNWHLLSKAFVDEESQVRDAVMNELSMMLIGEGHYRQGNLGFLPSLRFLACVTLCPDDDHHRSISGAAKVGRRATITKEAALKCIVSLRRTSEDTFLQCRAISKKAEENFEKNLKMKLMPEFTVPYAFHLLSFCPETPCGEFIRRKSVDQDDEEASHKLLRKRLRWLLEPLVQSLGDGADNISFLLRLTELLGQRYRPIDVFDSKSSIASPDSPFTDLSNLENDDTTHGDSSHAKLKVICAEAREILLKLVKKDSNLNPYPGVIQIPSFLYTRSRQSRSPTSVTKPISGPVQDSPASDYSSPSGNKKQKIAHKSIGEDSSSLSINLSPIPQSRSPGDMVTTEETMDSPDSGYSAFESTENNNESNKAKKKHGKRSPIRGARRSARLSKD